VSVTPLYCDIEHLFHTKCLRAKLEVKLECPVCRYEVHLQEQYYFQREIRYHIKKAKDRY